MKKYIFNLILILFVLFITVALIYGAGFFLERTNRYHLQGVHFAEKEFIYDEQLGWLAKKNFSGWARHYGFPREVFVSINKDGYRDADWDVKIKESESSRSKKILILGDSYTYGWGSEQDQIFSAQAQRYADKLKLNVTFFNAAIPGYGFMQYRRQIDLLIDKIRPDEVWMLVCVNDWGDSALPYDHRYIDRVYKPFYDEKGVLKEGKIKKRPSLFFDQDLNIKQNRFTIAADHLFYFFEDIQYLLGGIPTRWTSSLPVSRYDKLISSYDGFVNEEVVDREFASVNKRVDKLIADISRILKDKKIEFRIIPTKASLESFLTRFQADPSIDSVILPPVFELVISEPWGKNFKEGHPNYLWAAYLARHLVDKVFFDRSNPNGDSFKSVICEQLKTSIDFANEDSYIRNVFGKEWDERSKPLRPLPEMEGYFALANPFGEDAQIRLVMENDGEIVTDKFTLDEIKLLTTKNFLLRCIDRSEDGILFFAVKGSGLISAQVDIEKRLN